MLIFSAEAEPRYCHLLMALRGFDYRGFSTGHWGSSVKEP